MISMLKGQVVHCSTGSLTVMVTGVGFFVNVPEQVTHAVRIDDEVFLNTCLIGGRDESPALYGFIDPRQKEIFNLLIGVSGVGPKTAMNIISYIEPSMFLEQVVGENVAYLCTLPGIGKKGAQRIILELKEKIRKLYHVEAAPDGRGDIGRDAVAALMALGYTDTQASRAVAGLKSETVEDLVRLALKELM